MPDLDSILTLCRTFPDATEDMPWPDDLCFKIRGKIFVGIPLSGGRYPRITLKVTPEAFHELCEIEGIAPAAYVGRYNFVTLANPNVLPARELESLIRTSYQLVEAKAPRTKSAARSKSKSAGKRRRTGRARKAK
jgi:predicted DNA-binding protein (MmcQ/YjbR family)